LQRLLVRQQFLRKGLCSRRGVLVLQLLKHPRVGNGERAATLGAKLQRFGECLVLDGDAMHGRGTLAGDRRHRWAASAC
jgi:hypothetical protein